MALPVTKETRYGGQVELPAWRWREVLRALPQVERNIVTLAGLIAPAVDAAGDPNRHVRIALDAAQLATVERAYALGEGR